MKIIVDTVKITYIANTGDWRVIVEPGNFQISPQVGEFVYSSGTNLDNLATLILEAKADALSRGVNWDGN